MTRRTRKPYINKIVVKHIIENNPHPLEYLQQEYNDVSPELNEQYKKEDKERLESYGETWVFYGVMAEALIKKDFGEYIQDLGNITSGGIWGIESDSGDYLKGIDNEQIKELKGFLKELRVLVPKDVDIEVIEEEE